MDVNQSCIVVTGGSGFVGGALVKRLLTQGYRVRLISRYPRPEVQAELRGFLQRPDQLEWHQGDLADRSSLGRAFAGATHVFHVAALVDSAAPLDAFERCNVQATENVCHASLRSGLSRLIYISTCDVFGLPQPGEVITEETPYRKWNAPYPDTKIRAAEIVKAYRALGLNSSIIYPGWVYGPGDRAFFPALLRQIGSGLMPNWSPRDFEIHLVYIEDLVDAIVRVAARDAPADDDYLVLEDASGVTMRDLTDQLASHFGLNYRSLRMPYRSMYALAWTSQALTRFGIGARPLLTTADVKSFGHHFKYSAAKARNVLEWSPATPSPRGIAAALQWQAENVLTTGHQRKAS